MISMSKAYSIRQLRMEGDSVAEMYVTGTSTRKVERVAAKFGVEPDRILLEDRSTTTRENMVFSRAVIERDAGSDAGELAVGFSTTNYHVFRGYVCAHQAGMAAEGVGSTTRAYFWPNAFLREFVGLLVAKWKGILLMYLAIATLYGIAEYALVIA